MKRNEVISLFRFFFMAAIVAFHYAPKDFTAAYRVLAFCPPLPVFFFITSGFLAWMTASKAARFDGLEFICRRLSALMPAYYVSLALSFSFRISVKALTALLVASLFLQAWIPPFPMAVNAPAWFMSCLVSFLAFFPVLYSFIRKHNLQARNLLIAAFVLWLLTQILLTIALNHPSFYQGYGSFSHDLIFYCPMFHFSSFLFGVALGSLYLSPALRRPGKWTSLFLFGVMVSLVFIELLFEPIVAMTLLKLPRGVSLYAPLFTPLVLSMVLLHEDFTKVLDKPVVRRMGEISYPLYLLQYPVSRLWRLAGGTLADMNEFLLYFAVLTLVAWLFQVYVQDKAAEYCHSRLCAARKCCR